MQTVPGGCRTVAIVMGLLAVLATGVAADPAVARLVDPATGLGTVLAMGAVIGLAA